MIFLVTGGAGFIGSHVCEKLLGFGHEVISVDSFNDFYAPELKRDNIREIEKIAIGISSNCSMFSSEEGDIRDKQWIDSVLSKYRPDIVIHLAAYAGVRPSIENPELYYDVNINGTLVLLECMKKYSVSRCVFASSSSVYGNCGKVPFSESDAVDHPISPYAATKKAGELLCHVYHSLYGMSIACLRFFTVYGPRQRPDLAIRKFVELMESDSELPFYGDGTSERDYTYIDDVVEGVMGAVSWINDRDTPCYDIFNLGESRTVSLFEMVSVIEGALGKKAQIKRLPNQPGDVQKTYADISKSRKTLNYDPKTDFEDGIGKFAEWIALKKDCL